jgi:heme/copper-type cytochrome/quinol oxidase subunit 3
LPTGGAPWRSGEVRPTPGWISEWPGIQECVNLHTSLSCSRRKSGENDGSPARSGCPGSPDCGEGAVQNDATQGEAVALCASTGNPRSLGRMGMWLFLGTELILFASLLIACLVVRASVSGPDGDGWPTPAQAHMDVRLGLANACLLFLGSGLVALAVRSLAAGNTDRTTKLLVAAMAAACGFVALEGYELSGKVRRGLLPGRIGEVFPEGSDGARRYDDGPGAAWLETLKPRLEDVGGKEYRLITGKEKAAVPAGPAQMLDSVRRNTGKNLAYEILSAIDQGKATPSGAARRVFEANETVRGLNATADAENRFHEPEIPVPAALPHGNLWSLCWGTLSGLHALHLLAALAVVAVPAAAGLLGRLSRSSLGYLRNASQFWYFVTLVWIAVFLTIYLV